MPSTHEIAEVLWARCLEVDHKPGRVQFTKYLYFIDYCYWRFHSVQASDANWVFYHYGPWAPEAHAAMNELAVAYGFSWGEEEETVLRFVRVEGLRRLDLGLEGIIQHILRAFKDADLNRILEFAYRQTEPMLVAKRGEKLDFQSVPVDRSMPLFVPQPAKIQAFKLSPTRAAQLAAMREKRAGLRTMSESWSKVREAPAFHEAMRLLKQETVATLPLESVALGLSAEAIDSLNRE
jgi:hypothetical protein